MKRRDIASAVIDRVDYPNKGHFKIAETGETGVVKNVIPGQTVQFRVYKMHNHHAHAHLLNVLEPSPLETLEPACPHFGHCGGCLYQRLPYEKQLELKTAQLQKLLKPVLDEDTVFDGIQGSPNVTGYRNKLDLSFGNEEIDGPLTLGMHRMRSRYAVLDADQCILGHGDFRKITAAVRDYCAEQDLPFYNKLRHVGYLRYLMLRRSETTGEILMVLAVSTQMSHDFRPLGEILEKLELEGRIVGFYVADDDRLADALIPDALHCIFGRDYFHEHILGLTFRVTLFSFFQTNTRGSEVLYGMARSYVRALADQLPKKPVIYDLYCGTGTIAQMLAPEAGHVYGIEIVPEATEAARDNAAANGLHNCTFLTGDVFEQLPAISEKPDCIILDPPREGVREKALEKINAYDIDHMIYISCKATSFVDDMRYLRDCGWRVERWGLVDMFPETVHVECIALMTKERG